MARASSTITLMVTAPETPMPLLPCCSPVLGVLGVLGVLPGVIGALQATEAIKLLTGIGTPMIGRMLVYDGLDLSFGTVTGTPRACKAKAADRPTTPAPITITS